ncbi:MAG: S41 family peptidase [Prevotella sp.]|nr:S41 family peptidase [Candidatus Prevotella equi]
MPLIMALCVIVGILIGTFYANHFSGNRLNVINSGSNRLSNLLHIIDDQYVDTVNINDLVEKAMPQILAELDPHSVYISAKDAQTASDDLKGSFFGVGIEFVIREDTIHVQNVIAGGPAQKAGLLAGDKIVSIDGKPFVGKDVVTNEEAMHRLKGPDKSKVKVGILRYGSKKAQVFEITRGEVKTKSIVATYMIDDNTGYIRIKNFGENTYAEMLVSLAQLAQEGFDNLVIDLRDNTGGYLEAAVQMANEFLPKNRLIVYTEGRKSARQEYKTDGRGSYQKMPLVVLINEHSASASEIFAGAMQDNDRGTIIGRRSFGKGLVQQQIGFPDGSMIRLTVARYYTPSGRCIQKPYNSDNKDYQNDIITRYEHGEFFSADSIKHEGPEYHTVSGRVVYGGGGITPDIFVAEDTTDVTSYYREASMTGLILQFAYSYTDDNRLKLNNFHEMRALADHLVKQNTVELFATYADKRGLQRRNLMIKKSHHLLETYINSRIIYNMLDEQAWMQYLNIDDKTIQAALDFFYKK